MRSVALAAAGLCLLSLPAQSANVIFNGTVADTCDLSVMVPATGTMKLNGDHTILGSDQSGGAGVLLTIGSTGANTITVAAPTVTQSPAGYDPTGQQLHIGYTGASLLNGVSKTMGTGGGSFAAGILGITGSTILIHARIVNSNGFKLGDYQLTSVVTCS